MRAIVSNVTDFKSLDARSAGQQGQRRGGLPHHHHRGPHRLFAHAQEGDGAKIMDLPTGLSYATTAGNLRLHLSDFI
jgi:hypothetical protein